ncbi:MAG: tetratricopeptide repeat protein [Kofleriaceae bacterium]|nr:tetratricopeptide repeat protein [Kofleriaceae bacterium]
MMESSYSRETSRSRPVPKKKGGKASVALRTAILLLVFASCAGHTPPTKQATVGHDTESLVLQAQDAERSRNYHAARKLYQQAIDSAGDSTSAAYAAKEMASALSFWGEYEGAMELMLLSLTHRERQAPVWHDLGILRARSGALPAALTALQRAVAIAPKSARARVTLAALLVKMHEYKRALRHYRTLLGLKIPAKIERATHRAIKLLQVEIASQQQPATVPQ